MRGKFFRDNWLGIVGLVIGIVGLVASWYTYEKSRRYRDPIFVLDPVRTEIISRERVTGTPIRVTKADGRAVTSDLTSVRFYLWNDGSEAIRPQDVLEPLIIRIADRNAEILDVKVLRRSRAVTGLTVLSERERSSAAIVTFKILEQNDGFTGQIIYEGDPAAAITLDGTVEGARIRGSSDVAASRKWYEYLKSFGWVLFALLVVIGPTVFGKLSGWFAKLPAGRFKRILEMVGASLAIAFVLLVLVVLIWGVFIQGFREAEERASTNIVDSVPEQIRPRP